MTVQHVEDYFQGKDGFKLYEQCWMPQDAAGADAILVIVHGLAEHSGRYAHVGKFFAEQGFVVGAFDHRAHGKSDGSETVLKSIDDCANDVEVFVARMRERLPGKPVFVLGHSLGGLITTIYVLKNHPDVNGILLSGAALKISDEISPLLIKVAGILAKVAPKMKTIVLDGTAVSRDSSVVTKYDADPLNYRGGIPAATAGAMNSAIQYAQEHFADFKLPVRVMFGTDDRLADPEGSKALFAAASSEDKTLKPYEGLYHEIFNEPEQETVMAECLGWMRARM